VLLLVSKDGTKQREIRYWWLACVAVSIVSLKVAGLTESLAFFYFVFCYFIIHYKYQCTLVVV
jgi:hypothetical protein